MSKKEKINKDDLEFLKELLGEHKKEEIKGPDFREFKDLKKKISESSIEDGLIQFDKETEIRNRIGAMKSESEKTELGYSQGLNDIEKQKRSTKRVKIKKKQLFLEIAEALPLIKQNNVLLNKLIQALTEEPIKVKILK